MPQPGCHAERSEASVQTKDIIMGLEQMLRCAQHDTR